MNSGMSKPKSKPSPERPKGPPSPPPSRSNITPSPWNNVANKIAAVLDNFAESFDTEGRVEADIYKTLIKDACTVLSRYGDKSNWEKDYRGDGNFNRETGMSVRQFFLRWEAVLEKLDVKQPN